MRIALLGTCASSRHFSAIWHGLTEQEKGSSWKRLWAVTEHERLRKQCIIDSCVFALYGLGIDEVREIVSQCDLPVEKVHSNSVHGSLNPKGFWRLGKNKYPEHRHTVLTLVAFIDLHDKIVECSWNKEAGIEAFCSQNNGEGWMLPKTLRLADYGLGHDERSQIHQPVQTALGSQYYDWQLAQEPEESWRECYLHARNILGPGGGRNLLEEFSGQQAEDLIMDRKVESRSQCHIRCDERQNTLNHVDDLPLFLYRENEEY